MSILHKILSLYRTIRRSCFFVRPLINKGRSNWLSFTTWTCSSSCITVWNMSSPSVLVRSRYEKSQFPVSSSPRRAPPLCRTAALTSLPLPARQVPLPTPSPAASGTSGSFITLALPSSPAPVTVILAGARYVPGPATGASTSSIMSQTSRDAWEHKGRERERDREWARQREIMPSLPVLHLFSVSLTYCALKALWEWTTWVCHIEESVAIEFDGRQRGCKYICI